jgi:hypothetical protein
MAKDILTDIDGDVLLNNNDLAAGDGDAQNLERLLMLNTGELKHAPLLGCNMIRLTNGRINPQVVIRDIELNLKADAWKNVNVDIKGGDIKVDAIR